MERFEWAENNLRVGTPHELQEQGVQVYFAPNVRANERIVDLDDGRVDVLKDDEPKPETGYFAQLESLERYCLREGIPLSERDGRMVAMPESSRIAGDPLTADRSRPL
ncbi:MAG: hypothetical protein M0R74_11855 [Dehalococcoidia bacterium]|nr:hypothetical protein [Dehalococcoidia bacterium]